MEHIWSWRAYKNSLREGLSAFGAPVVEVTREKASVPGSNLCLAKGSHRISPVPLTLQHQSKGSLGEHVAAFYSTQEILEAVALYLVQVIRKRRAYLVLAYISWVEIPLTFSTH